MVGWSHFAAASLPPFEPVASRSGDQGLLQSDPTQTRRGSDVYQIHSPIGSGLRTAFQIFVAHNSPSLELGTMEIRNGPLSQNGDAIGSAQACATQTRNDRVSLNSGEFASLNHLAGGITTSSKVIARRTWRAAWPVLASVFKPADQQCLGANCTLLYMTGNRSRFSWRRFRWRLLAASSPSGRSSIAPDDQH